MIRWPMRPGTRVGNNVGVYFTDRGIEELLARRGEEQVSLAWLAERLREFVDLNPEFDDGDRAAGHLAGARR